jgi:hypothetical protein
MLHNQSEQALASARNTLACRVAQPRLTQPWHTLCGSRITPKRKRTSVSDDGERLRHRTCTNDCMTPGTQLLSSRTRFAAMSSLLHIPSEYCRSLEFEPCCVAAVTAYQGRDGGVLV